MIEGKCCFRRRGKTRECREQEKEECLPGFVQRSHSSASVRIDSDADVIYYLDRTRLPVSGNDS